MRLEDPDLVKLLAKNDISYRAVQEETWLTSLLSWVFPFVLLIAIWIYFFRKIGSGAGAMLDVDFGATRHRAARRAGRRELSMP